MQIRFAPIVHKNSSLWRAPNSADQSGASSHTCTCISSIADHLIIEAKGPKWVLKIFELIYIPLRDHGTAEPQVTANAGSATSIIMRFVVPEAYRLSYGEFHLSWNEVKQRSRAVDLSPAPQIVYLLVVYGKMASNLPDNVHVSTHPCLMAKLSQLRMASTKARETKTLIHEISQIVACEALAQGLSVQEEGTDVSPLGYEFNINRISPSKISLIPILRSGLAMVDALQSLLPEPVPVNHLGLFRDKTTMTAIEYYNNLPYHRATSGEADDTSGPSDLVILVDPVVATGATACAAIDTIRDWGAKRIIMICVISTRPGLIRAAEQWPEGIEIWAGGMDDSFDDHGMIEPGVGDIGDRLFLTIGK